MELERETEIILPATVKLYVSRTIYPDEVISVKREEFRKAPKELVRCKDCDYWDRGHTEECDNSDSVCFHNGWCKPDFYCADGWRRGVAR